MTAEQAGDIPMTRVAVWYCRCAAVFYYLLQVEMIYSAAGPGGG